MSGSARAAAPADALAQWHRQGTYFLWRDQRIFLACAGEGSVILLIHGYPTASYDWHLVWRTLASRHRVLAPDLLGLGFSDKPTGHTYSITDHADMIEALLAHAGHREVHVVAHDLGVSVAQELLARQLERKTDYQIRSLVLLNGGLCPEAYRPRLIQRLLASPLGPWLGPRVPRRAVERSVRALFARARPPSAGLLDHFWQLIRHNEGLQVAHVTGRFWVDRLKHRDRLVKPLLSRAVPCRLINGAVDPNSGDHMQAMAEVERLLRASDVQIEVADPFSDEAKACIQAYFEELRERFDEGFDPRRSVSAEPEELVPPSGWLLIARLEGAPVGCGALKLDGARMGEIKRMWVAPAARGMGVAQRLLASLEARAVEAGVDVLRLDTHRSLTEARALYLRNQYVEIPAYNANPYAHHWFEKRGLARCLVAPVHGG